MYIRVFFFLRARVYLHTHIGAACFTWRDGRVLVDSHKQIHAQETSETERRMRARGARHCKRMLIIFTSCNSVTLNHRQATSLPRPLFRVIIVFLFSRARAQYLFRDIAITTDATCDYSARKCGKLRAGLISAQAQFSMLQQII